MRDAMSSLFAVLITSFACAESSLQGPVAVEFLGNGDLACVATQKNGTLQLVDLSNRHVISKVPAGDSLSHLVVARDDNLIFVADNAANRVLGFRCKDRTLLPVGQCPVPDEPVRLSLSGDGRRLYVSCLWAKCVIEIEIDAQAKETMRVGRIIDVPLSPRDLVVLDEQGKVLVADSFSGKLVAVDIESGAVGSIRRIAGHNLRGMSVSGDRLLISQQVLNPLAPTTRDNIIWSVLMTNCVRDLSVDKLLDPNSDPMSDSRFIPLGTVGQGAGDPAAMVIAPDGQMYVCLSGVHQVAVLSPDGRQEARIVTGTRPLDIAAHPGGEGYVVANYFSDSLTWISKHSAANDAETYVKSKREATTATYQDESGTTEGRYRYPTQPVRRDDAIEIPIGDVPKLSLVDQGEQLFYDATVSHDRWMSCHSCHTDGHTNGGQADTLGDGDYGAPKQIMSLHGVAHTGPWAWDGSMPVLRQQIQESIKTSMRGRAASERQLDALEAFLQTLTPPRPPRLEVDADLVSEGARLFQQRGCRECHAGQHLTSASTFDVGLEDEIGKRRFNPPSLKSVVHRQRLLHDGRAMSVRELLEEVRHPEGNRLPRKEVDALVEYLRSL